MKSKQIFGALLTQVIRTRQILNGNNSKSLINWANKQKDLGRKLSTQRKILSR